MSTRAHRPGRAVTTLADFRTQRVNANKHTPRGLGMLDAALSEDGYVAPMTAAADGEIIDGSARLERAAEHFGPDVEPIVVEHDGRRPIVMVRTDIPSADTEVAARISLRANRIAQADLAWSAEDLQQIAATFPDATKGLWTAEELAEVMATNGAPSEVDAEPQIDRAAELQKEWGTATGQLWQLGEHHLLVPGRYCRRRQSPCGDLQSTDRMLRRHLAGRPLPLCGAGAQP
jgi:hypothetical protein